MKKGGRMGDGKVDHLERLRGKKGGGKRRG